MKLEQFCEAFAGKELRYVYHLVGRRKVEDFNQFTIVGIKTLPSSPKRMCLCGIPVGYCALTFDEAEELLRRKIIKRHVALKAPYKRGGEEIIELLEEAE